MTHDGCLLLVATGGGHLVDLQELAERLPPFSRRLWVTFDSVQGRSLLTKEPTVFVPEIFERDVAGVLRAFTHARQIIAKAHPVSAVVSTGSAIALAFLPYCAARGISAHYIECSARTDKPSLTGRLVAKVPGIHLYRQYEQAAGGRWGYGGSVFDGFESMTVPARPVHRVVVTLGTMNQGFRRLVERLLAIIPSDVSVFWQTGGTVTEGLGIVVHRLVPPADLEAAMREADVVVSHSGCGSALTALKAGKWPILVPRNPESREVVDPHQREIAAWLEARGLALSRSPELLTFDDLELAAGQVVVRASVIPRFRLAGTGDTEAATACSGSSMA